MTGVGPVNQIGIPVSPFELTLMQKRLPGSLFGQCNQRSDIPRQIHMYRTAQLKLDELVTRIYKLEEIVPVYEDLNAGRNIRGVILYN